MQRETSNPGGGLIRLTLKRKTDLVNVTKINPSKRRKEIAEEFGVTLTIITGILEGKRIVFQWTE